MKNILIALFLVFLSSSILAGEWVAVDGGVVEVDLKEKEVESLLWSFISKTSERKFEPKDEYTFQYQAVTKEKIKIGAMCRYEKNIDLTKSFYTVFDGGTCYFEVIYNMKNNDFTELYIHGEA